MLQHGLCLVEEAPVLEGGDEVAHGFALDADGGAKHIVADSEHAGDDYHAAAVQEGWEGAAEFADIDDDAGGLGCGGEAAATGDACVDCSEELLLGVVRAFTVEC